MWVGKIHDYVSDIGRMDEICRSFRERIRKEFFTDINGTQRDYATPYHWPYLPLVRTYFTGISRFIEICDMFGVMELESAKHGLQRILHKLEEEGDETKYWKNTNVLIDNLATPFIKHKTELQKVLEQLEPMEKERINEAIHVYLEHAYYSSVAMSVSAIEYRLLNLMKAINPQNSKELDEMTLGALINEYLEHEADQYQNLLPARHKPLLQLCNTYRIFSVHPKEQKIDRRVATSVLNLTLEFLLDPETKVIEKF